MPHRTRFWRVCWPIRSARRRTAFSCSVSATSAGAQETEKPVSVSLTSGSSATPALAPVTSRPSDADCGPRALLLLCQEAKLPATLPALSKTAGVTAPRERSTAVYNSATSVTTTLTWDGQERLKTVGNGSFSNAYAYNGLDQRSDKSDSGGTFSYLRAGDGIASPVLSDGAATYNYGAGLVSEVRNAASKFYQSDALGSTRELTNSSGSVTDAHETDAFGNTVAASGNTATPFGFAGQAGYQSDADTGLKLLGHRYYDSSTGRFLSRDPIRDGNNWYAYCGNDPVNALDPEGKIIVILIVGALLIGAAAAIRDASERSDLNDEARENKLDRWRAAYADDWEEHDRLEEEKRQIIDKTEAKIKDEAVDAYFYGPIGETSDAAKIGVEGFKEAKKAIEGISNTNLAP